LENFHFQNLKVETEPKLKVDNSLIYNIFFSVSSNLSFIEMGTFLSQTIYISYKKNPFIRNLQLKFKEMLKIHRKNCKKNLKLEKPADQMMKDLAKVDFQTIYYYKQYYAMLFASY